MAERSWLRWHLGTVADPKWRAIGKRAKQPVHAVLAVWALMLESAGQAAARGSLAGWRDDDAAAALDLEHEIVAAIRDAMQGKVLDGDRLIGWESQQPKREDDEASTRKRRQRDREKGLSEDGSSASRNVTQCHAMSRNVTQCHSPSPPSSLPSSPPFFPPPDPPYITPHSYPSFLPLSTPVVWGEFEIKFQDARPLASPGGSARLTGQEEKKGEQASETTTFLLAEPKAANETSATGETPLEGAPVAAGEFSDLLGYDDAKKVIHRPAATGAPSRGVRGSRLPKGWEPDAELLAWARTERPDLDARRETEGFRDFWAAKAGADACKMDWRATWRNWMRKARSEGPSRQNGRANGTRLPAPLREGNWDL